MNPVPQRLQPEHLARNVLRSNRGDDNQSLSVAAPISFSKARLKI